MKSDVLNTIGFFISRTQAKLQKHFLQELKPYGITREQWVLFARIAEEEGISPTELSQISFSDKPYTTRLIDKLEKRGLIRKEESQDDKRSSLLYLTKQGAEFIKELRPINARVNKWAVETLSEDEVRQLKFLLNKMYDHIKD